MSERPIRPQPNRQQFVAPNFVPGTGNQGWPGLNPNQLSQGHIPRPRNNQPPILQPPSQQQQQNHGNLQGLLLGTQKPPPPRQPTSHRSSSSKKVRNPLLEKEHRTQSWHDYPKEKKIVHLKKKHAADVFPQHPDQEEDNLTPERIKRGYFAHIWQGENESALPKFMANPNLGDELLTRVVDYIQQIVPTKNDDINLYLEKKRINAIHFQFYGSKSDGPGLNSRVLSWISELKKGKSATSLVRKVPLYNEFEDGSVPQGSVLLNAGPSRPLELAYEHKIPIPLAVWYLITHHVGVSTMAQNEKLTINNKQINPPLKKSIEMCDYTINFVKILKEILEKIDEEPSQKKQKWKYYTFFIRTAVMTGMVDRQEFLTEICDLLWELHQKPMEKIPTFQMLLSFATLFTSEIVQNVFLSRKYLYLTALKLKAYVDEAAKKKKIKSSLNPYTILTDLLSCVHNRSIIMNCIGLATSIICDCPTAAVWSPLEEPFVPPHLVGTALEHFPIDPAFFSLFFKNSKNFSKKYRQLMMKKLDEIKERSINVDQRWALNNANYTGFQTVMRACVDVIGLLDTADVFNPRSFLGLYAKLFGLTRDNESFENETIIRIKTMFHWAITQEREGSHRAFLVTKMLLLHVEHFNSMLFDGKSIVYIMVDFLNKEGPTTDKKGFKTEFSNLMLLLMELQRAKLFNHDEYVSLLLRYGMINTKDPIYFKLKKIMDSKKPPEPKVVIPPPASEPEIIEIDVDPVVVSFIPPPSELRSAKAAEKKELKSTELCTLKDSEDNDRPFLEKTDDLTMHERILTHVPIDQNEENRGLINQRTNIIYGISDERENVRVNLKRFAMEIIKIWNRHSIKLYNSRRAVKKKNARKDLNKIFQEFRTFTYYDQLSITGMCSDGYLQLIKAFPRYGDTFPNMECFDMLLAMFEQSQSLSECFEFILELLPHVFNCEEAIDEIRTDCSPGFFSSQQCFVIVGFLADHYKLFILSKVAGSIANGLYRLIEKEVNLAGYPKSCWARTTAAFLAQVRYDLRNYELPNPHGHQIQLAFQTKNLKNLLPECGNVEDYTDATYNPLLLSFLINPPRRCICYHDYKERLPSIDNSSSKYSFILNAFKTGKVIQNDYEKISELANTCGHISSEKDLTTEWLTIIESLCTPLSGKRNLPGFSTLEQIEDMKSIFFYSTFITLLASRFCFSTHSLFVRLNNQAILPYLKCSKNESVQIQMLLENKARFLLTVQIITNIVTASDEPFKLSKDFYYTDQERTYVLKRPTDVRLLRILHIRELDAMILSILTNIFYICENIVKKEESLKDIYKFTFNSVLIMSDQEWVIERIFQICQNDQVMEEFNKEKNFEKDSSLGQYLLRMAMRRKTERETKIEFISQKSSKKALIDKIFNCLNIWNLRASYCDFKVMIRDATTGKNGKASAQSAGFSDALLREICRGCRDFFFSAEKLNEIKIPQILSFELKDLNSYWLISELMDIISPENVTKTMKFIFLEDIRDFLLLEKITDGNDKIKRMKQSAELLGQQPFINMILICQNCEDNGKEIFVSKLLNFCLDLMSKYEKSPELLLTEEFQLERETLLLRLNLIGSMIDFNFVTSDYISNYISLLFQLLYNEIITIEKDGKYFYHIYDMLTICIMSQYNVPCLLQQNVDLTKTKYYPDYQNFIKKLKKDLIDKIIPTKMYLLQQLLPLKLTTSEIQNFNDVYVLPSPIKTSNNKTNNGTTIAGFVKNVKSSKTDKFSEPPQKRLLRMLHHTHQYDFYHPGTPGNSLTKQQLQNFIIGPPNYAKQQIKLHPQQSQLQTQLPLQQQPQPQQQQLRPMLPNMGNQLRTQIPLQSGQIPIQTTNWNGTNPNIYPPRYPPTNSTMLPPPNPGFNPTNQFNPMLQQHQQQQQQQLSGYNPRIGMDTMMRPPIPNISPSTRQIRKRGSNQTITPPQNQRMPKRLKRDIETLQIPQLPGPGLQQIPPPNYFSQQTNQGTSNLSSQSQQPPPPSSSSQSWQQQQQQYNRFHIPNQQMLNSTGIGQRPENSEAKKILQAQLQQRKKDKQSQQQIGSGNLSGQQQQQQLSQMPTPQQQQIRQNILQQQMQMNQQMQQQQYGGQRMPAPPMNMPNQQQQFQIPGQSMLPNQQQQNFNPPM